MNRTILSAAAAAAMAATTASAAAQEAAEIQGPDGPVSGTYIAAAQGQPAVIIIPGSGPTDRDGNNPLGVTAAPYRMLAEALAERGIGSLRADKRGLFASASALKDPAASRIAGYVEDANAWSALIRERSGADCVWLLGHSEGGIVALAAAQSLGNLCGIVLVASPGRSIGTVLREQLRANPANAPILSDALSAIDRLEAGEPVDTSAMHPALQGLFGPQVQGFMMDLMAYRPAEMASRVTIPMMIVQGGKDIQVAQADADALHSAQPGADLLVLADMNHVLKDVESDDQMANLAAYANPDLPLAAGLVDAIASFVKNVKPAE